jgi:branched-chain amino acid transport system ATP-binding protein
VLRLIDIRAGYDNADVLHGVSLDVARGAVASLLGSNGAGKTTAMRVAGGYLQPRAGRGKVLLAGQDITNVPAEGRAELGIGQVLEGRHLFSGMSVMDNLELGGRSLTGRERAKVLAEVLEMFPILGERRRQAAGSLSGGEAQMLAIGRALMCKPRYLLMDEPSLGLAPLIVASLLEKIAQLAQEHDLGILLAEQNASLALAVSTTGYVMERGAITMSGAASQLQGNQEVVDRYLGGAEEQHPEGEAVNE